MAPTSGQKEAREEIRIQTPLAAARQTAKGGESQRKPRNKYRDRDRYRRAKARRRMRLQLRDAIPMVFPHLLAEKERTRGIFSSANAPRVQAHPLPSPARPLATYKRRLE